MEKIRWAPKIRQAKIWELYHNDASGRVDEDLIKDVAFTLYHRCSSIRMATRREVECPRCGAVFKLAELEEWRLLPGVNSCPTASCGWGVTREEWHRSWENRDLLGAAAMEAIETYLRAYAQNGGPEESMLRIDQLIHAFHISLQTGKAGRSFANNLIEGSHKQVVDFLDRLSALPGGVDKEQWRAEVGAMFKRRNGQE